MYAQISTHMKGHARTCTHTHKLFLINIQQNELDQNLAGTQRYIQIVFEKVSAGEEKG